MTQILLVRHGQSTWNADGRWQGRADPPLSDLGRRQAEAAVDTIRHLGIARLVASPLVRAHETASIVGRALDLEVESEARLAERDAGEWTGRTHREIEAGWPGYLAGGRRPPGFETDDVLHERALAAVREIAGAASAPVVVVSHGGLIRVVERALGSEPHRVPNLGGLDIRVDGLQPGSADAAPGPVLSLAGRVVLVDAHDVTVTTPPEV
jgi:probable phosphoglycerate mutase